MTTNNICKLTFSGLITVLTLSFQPSAAIVDSTFDDNRNDFSNYWYYYDDNSSVDKNSRSKVAVPGTPSNIDVPYLNIVRHAFGDTTDNWLMKSYTFQTGPEANGNRYAHMPFTMGSTWNALYGTATPYVGIGTMLAPEGQSINLSGATSISFKLRSRVYPLTVNFKVQTKEIDDYSNVPNPKADASGYYARAVTATKGAWSTVTVRLNSDDLVQPTSWCKAFPWDYTSNVTRLVWEIPGSINPALKEGTKDTLDIDDITINGFSPCAPNVWCDTVVSIPKTGLFSTFEFDPKDECALGTRWYAYNDAEIGGTSIIDTASAETIEGSKYLAIKINSGNGAGGSYAPAVKFTLGPPINQNGIMTNGFAGIGIDTYDSINCKYWDAQSTCATSIFFQYTFQGDADYLTLEINDSNDVGDSKNPTRKDKRGQGVAWFKNLPPTPEGVWRSVEIPFSDLSIHYSWVGANPIPLDLKALTRFRWKVQGTEGQKGMFAIDNIYFPGFTRTGCSTGVNNFVIKSAKSPFYVSYRNGAVDVNCNIPKVLADGRISLINARGMIVSSIPVSKTANFTKNFSLKNITSGIYFVKLDAIDTNGKAVVMQTYVSVIR